MTVLMSVGAAETVGAGETACEGDILHGLFRGGEHRIRLFEPQPPEHGTGSLGKAQPELPDKVLAADAALGRHGFEIYWRAKVVSQIMVAKLDGVRGMRLLHLLAIKRDQHPMEEFGLVEAVAKCALLEACEDFIEERRRFRSVWHREQRAEFLAQLRK